MAKRVFDRLFFFPFLSLFLCCSSGTLVGFFYYPRENTISFLKQNNVSPSQIRAFVSDHKVLSSLSNTGVSIDLYFNQSHLESLTKSKSSGVTWLETHVISFLPLVNIKSIVAIIEKDPTRHNDLAWLLSTLQSLHSLLCGFGLDSQVKVSVAFPLSFVKNLRGTHERDLCRIISYVKEVKSYIIVEEAVKMGGDGFVQSVIQKANFAVSVIPCNDVPMVLTIKSPSIPSPKQVSEFSDKVSKALQNNTHITSNMVALYVELPRPTSRRELLINTAQHDTENSPTIFPVPPITNTPTTPTIITVNPSPVTINPANPETPVVTLPLTTPPITNPVTTPITVPGAQPITNPVTTYPTPSVNVPTTTPVTTNPVAPPASNNIPGQSWCVAKSGAPEIALQTALDYACGGGADCSQIQQGGSCYNPNTLQNHASYAFNSYYQKNPMPTSCDFGGTATLVNANPSTGSCIYPTSSSSSTTVSPSSTTPVIPTPSTPTASIPTPPPPTLTNPAAPSWGAGSGSGTPPTVLNTSTGTTPDFGLESPPGFTNSSTSKAVGLRPFIGFIFLATFLVTRKITRHVEW